MSNQYLYKSALICGIMAVLICSSGCAYAIYSQHYCSAVFQAILVAINLLTLIHTIKNH